MLLDVDVGSGLAEPIADATTPASPRPARKARAKRAASAPRKTVDPDGDGRAKQDGGARTRGTETGSARPARAPVVGKVKSKNKVPAEAGALPPKAAIKRRAKPRPALLDDAVSAGPAFRDEPPLERPSADAIPALPVPEPAWLKAVCSSPVPPVARRPAPFTLAPATMAGAPVDRRPIVAVLPLETAPAPAVAPALRRPCVEVVRVADAALAVRRRTWTPGARIASVPAGMLAVTAVLLIAAYMLAWPASPLRVAQPSVPQPAGLPASPVIADRSIAPSQAPAQPVLQAPAQPDSSIRARATAQGSPSLTAAVEPVATLARLRPGLTGAVDGQPGGSAATGTASLAMARPATAPTNTASAPPPNVAAGPNAAPLPTQFAIPLPPRRPATLLASRPLPASRRPEPAAPDAETRDAYSSFTVGDRGPGTYRLPWGEATLGEDRGGDAARGPAWSFVPRR